MFGKTYDQAKYRAVIEACSLEEDFKSLSNGDMTAVGEGGVTLSGGQKARIALARAVYQDKTIYFLDDVLSAVDIHVGQNIFQKCINGLLRNKTKILCTHLIQYFLTADKIYVLDHGRIVNHGKPGDILSDLDGMCAEMGSLEERRVESSEEEKEEISEQQEERETGAVKMTVYSNYWLSIGHALAISILISLALMQLSRNISDWWLSYWVTHAQYSNASVSCNSHKIDHTFILQYRDDLIYYLSIYGSIAALNTAFTLVRAFLFAYGGKPGDILSDLDGMCAEMGSLEERRVESSEEEKEEISEQQEERETGAVKMTVYSNYWLSIGHALAISILISLALMQLSRNISDWWLSYWVTHAQYSNASVSCNSHKIDHTFILQYRDDLMYYLSIYGSIAALNTAFTLVRAFLFAYGGIKAANNIHSLLLDTII
ncbi:hypothetical protein J437_LFUL018889, partial [Ladona fulva]